MPESLQRHFGMRQTSIEKEGHMDDFVRRQIMGIRSKYCEPILELLAKEGELYHGDLSEKLNMSPSGLSVIIKKMQECDPPIIEVMQIGKYKIYTLPQNVKEYMEESLIKRKNEEETKADQENEPAAAEEDIMLCMQHFVEKAGEQWKDILSQLLRDVPCNADKEIRMCFDRLMVLIVDSAKYKEDSIDELNRFINNEVLKFLIEDYLSEIEECEKILNDIRKREGGEKLLRHFRIQ